MKEASQILSETGKKTGLMVSMGQNESYIVPIFETFVVNHAIINFEITGKDIEKYFKRLLQQEIGLPRDYRFRYYSGNLYVAIDPDQESARIKGEKSAKKTGWNSGESSYMVSECIFKPILGGKDSEGLDQAIVNVLGKCEVNFRRGLCNNIVIYGSAVLPGLRERLQKEIQKRFQGTIEVNVSSISKPPTKGPPKTPTRLK